MSNDAKTVVLIADDEPSTLALLGRHLRSRGYSVLEAADGDEAWELAHEHLPDLVILDVMMPGMSGWEVCRKVREAVSLAHTGVIMLTGIGETLNEMTSPLYGADAHVDKPFEFASLDARIDEVLERRRAGALGRPDHADEEVRLTLPRETAKPVAKAKPPKAKPVAKAKPPVTKPSAKPKASATPKKAAKTPLAAPSMASAKPKAKVAGKAKATTKKSVKKVGPDVSAAKRAKGMTGAAKKPVKAATKASTAKAPPPKAKGAKQAPPPKPKAKAKAKAKAKPAKAEPVKAKLSKAKPAKAKPPKAKPAKAKPEKKRR
jgi:CheY-like chemotaxis protein